MMEMMANGLHHVACDTISVQHQFLCKTPVFESNLPTCSFFLPSHLFHFLVPELHNYAMSSTSERQMIELLAERAKLLADGAQFDHALHDAATIRALAPASSVGYLLAGDVYQMQGRQRAAVSMYEDGLASVPENEDGYTHLSNRRTDALHADAKHVDFISQLFLDNVVNVIFPIILDSELSTETPCPYLYVCRAWRRRILENYGLRFQVTVSIIQGQHDQLVKFADHVKSLAIIDFYESANDFYADILKKAHFPKLNILTIRGK